VDHNAVLCPAVPPRTPYRQLSPRGQVRRLRPLAEEALRAFGLRDPRVTFIHHGENTTWRIDLPRPLPGPVPTGCHPSRLLLRLHRGTYNHPPEIASELLWLEALRRETDLVVPVPWRLPDGAPYLEWDDPAIGGHRVATATRWIEGRMADQRVTPSHYEALGVLMARLHNHAAAWRRPRAFRRVRWHERGLAAPDGNADRGSGDAWALLPADARRVFRRVRDRAMAAMERLGDGPEAYGLIHCDLHPRNVVFHHGEARPLDFDDCLIGHWAYDLAVTLRGTGEGALPALLRGYRRVRCFPDEQLRPLPVFLAARYASVMLWIAVRATENRRFEALAARWLPASLSKCEELLRRR